MRNIENVRPMSSPQAKRIPPSGSNFGNGESKADGSRNMKGFPHLPRSASSQGTASGLGRTSTTAKPRPKRGSKGVGAGFGTAKNRDSWMQAHSSMRSGGGRLWSASSQGNTGVGLTGKRNGLTLSEKEEGKIAAMRIVVEQESKVKDEIIEKLTRQIAKLEAKVERFSLEKDGLVTAKEKLLQQMEAELSLVSEPQRELELQVEALESHIQSLQGDLQESGATLRREQSVNQQKESQMLLLARQLRELKESHKQLQHSFDQTKLERDAVVEDLRRERAGFMDKLRREQRRATAAEQTQMLQNQTVEQTQGDISNIAAELETERAWREKAQKQNTTLVARCEKQKIQMQQMIDGLKEAEERRDRAELQLRIQKDRAKKIEKMSEEKLKDFVEDEGKMRRLKERILQREKKIAFLASKVKAVENALTQEAEAHGISRQKLKEAEEALENEKLRSRYLREDLTECRRAQGQPVADAAQATAAPQPSRPCTHSTRATTEVKQRSPLKKASPPKRTTSTKMVLPGKPAGKNTTAKSKRPVKKSSGRQVHISKGTKRDPRAQVPAPKLAPAEAQQQHQINSTKVAVATSAADDFDDEEDDIADLPPTDPTEEAGAGMSHFMEHIDAASSGIDDLLALRARRKAERQTDSDRAERQAKEVSRLSKPRQRAKRPQDEIPDAARLSGSDAPSWMKY